MIKSQECIQDMPDLPSELPDPNGLDAANGNNIYGYHSTMPLETTMWKKFTTTIIIELPSFVKQIHPKWFFCFFGTPSQKIKAKILLKKSSTRKKNSMCIYYVNLL